MPNIENDIWIKRVEIINFQSLKQIDITLSKGINAFIGSSNSGKTAVIRAIRWCLLNKPNGNHFITKGQKEAVVRVHLSNNKTIERRKSTSNVNLYRLFDEGELIGEYTGFGTSVPAEIVNAHGIVPIANDVYFQFALQLEGPFLLSLKPSKRADVLGDMNELKTIDTALADINKDIRDKGDRIKETKKEKKQLEKVIGQAKKDTQKRKASIETLQTLKLGLERKLSLQEFLKDKMVRLKDVERLLIQLEGELESSVRILQAWPTDLEERTLKFKRISEKIERLSSIQGELQKISHMKMEKIDELGELTNKIDGDTQRFKQIKGLIGQLKKNEELASQIKYSERVAAIDTESLDKDINKYRLLYHHLDRLRAIDKQLEDTDRIVQEASGRIEDMLFQFAESLKEAEICPTCGQETHGVCKQTVETIV